MEKTISIQGRVEIISLATLARAYEEGGLRLRSKSDILWHAIEQLSAAYQKQGIVPFETVEDALSYMESLRIPLATSARTRREVQNAQVKQNLEMDFPDYRQGARVTKDMLQKSDREEYEEAAAAIRGIGGTPISFEQFMENKKAGERSELLASSEQSEQGSQKGEREDDKNQLHD